MLNQCIYMAVIANVTMAGCWVIDVVLRFEQGFYLGIGCIYTTNITIPFVMAFLFFFFYFRRTPWQTRRFYTAKTERKRN